MNVKVQTKTEEPRVSIYKKGHKRNEKNPETKHLPRKKTKSTN